MNFKDLVYIEKKCIHVPVHLVFSKIVLIIENCIIKGSVRSNGYVLF